jgi:hypothetical protein
MACFLVEAFAGLNLGDNYMLAPHLGSLERQDLLKNEG